MRKSINCIKQLIYKVWYITWPQMKVSFMEIREPNPTLWLGYHSTDVSFIYNERNCTLWTEDWRQNPIFSFIWIYAVWGHSRSFMHSVIWYTSTFTTVSPCHFSLISRSKTVVSFLYSVELSDYSLKCIIALGASH